MLEGHWLQHFDWSHRGYILLMWVHLVALIPWLFPGARYHKLKWDHCTLVGEDLVEMNPLGVKTSFPSPLRIWGVRSVYASAWAFSIADSSSSRIRKTHSVPYCWITLRAACFCADVGQCMQEIVLKKTSIRLSNRSTKILSHWKHKTLSVVISCFTKMTMFKNITRPTGRSQNWCPCP